MLKKIMVVAVGSVALSLSTGATAASIIYTGAQTLGPVIATYSITTDGTLGAIDTSHLSAFDVTLADSKSTLAFSRNSTGGTGGDTGSFFASATSLTIPLFESLALYTNARNASGFYIGALRFDDSDTLVQNTDAAHGNGLTFIASEPNRSVAFATAAAVSAVPEPATWLTMILGMGAIGFAMRRRKNVNTTVQFA
jgi:hypothetical protein